MRAIGATPIAIGEEPPRYVGERRFKGRAGCWVGVGVGVFAPA